MIAFCFASQGAFQTQCLYQQFYILRAKPGYLQCCSWHLRCQIPETFSCATKQSLVPGVASLLKPAEGTQGVCPYLVCKNWDSLYFQGRFVIFPFQVSHSTSSWFNCHFAGFNNLQVGGCGRIIFLHLSQKPVNLYQLFMKEGEGKYNI